MNIFEILLLGIAILLTVGILLLAVASAFAFFGAMSMPEDINDDVPGDAK